MRSDQPPAAATWLLDRFCADPCLAGDLIEEYRDRQSTSWYWKQAIVAVSVYSTSQILQHKWLAVRAIATEAETEGFQTHWGRKVLEVRPPVHIDKGVGVRNNLEHRRGAFKNRERLNRLLMLMQLDLNKQADEQSYAKVIRAELLAGGGYAAPRRQIVDRVGASLRLYDL